MMPATFHNACLRDNIVNPNVMGFTRNGVEYLAIVSDTCLHSRRTAKQPVIISAAAAQSMTFHVKAQAWYQPHHPPIAVIRRSQAGQFATWFKNSVMACHQIGGQVMYGDHFIFTR